MINIAIIASGSGTNAEAIMAHFKNHAEVSVSRILTNNKDAGVIERAQRFSVPCSVFSKADLENGQVLSQLKEKKIHFIVLAGFLLKVPVELIRAFPDKICNIHPALLPKYGGKGMYGDHVHKAVIDAGEKESGISIHLVNEEYDKGKILFQASAPVLPEDTTESLAGRIHLLEHRYYPMVVEEYLEKIQL